MGIFYKALNKIDYLDFVSEAMEALYDINHTFVIDQIAPFDSRIREDISVLFEFPYVDKFYRDSYYFYFSKKHRPLMRDSIRLSFFQGIVSKEDFYEKTKHSLLKSNFLGYITLRPTRRNILGRNLVSPELFKNSDFSFISTSFDALINGVRLNVEAFPHSSQDGESISCAETSILNLMEYMGNRYSQYAQVLPSQITKTISTRSDERNLPTEGLTLNDISFVLKSFGLYPKIYSKKVIGREKLKRTLDMYIESGIPVIVAIKNKHCAHAIIAVGRAKIDFFIPRIASKDEKIEFLLDYNKDYVLIDDNLPPYAFATYDDWTKEYPGIDSSFKNCELTGFVVPLHHKVYVDALLVMRFYESLREEFLNRILERKKYFTRIYLISSSLLKEKINEQDSLNKEIKILLIETAMPKYVWVIEIINGENLEEHNLEGIIVIDPTETSLYFTDHLLFFLVNDKLIITEREDTINVVKKDNVGQLKMILGNLKGDV